MFGIKVGKTTLLVSMLAVIGLLPLQAAAECKFVSTKAGNAPFEIKVTDKDTPEAKEFLETCNNPYTKKFVADAEAAKAGKDIALEKPISLTVTQGRAIADAVIVNGGLGPTVDDLSQEVAAEASGVKLVSSPSQCRSIAARI